MMDHVYELTKIIREKGNLPADEYRIGTKYIPVQLEKGYPAILVHANNHDVALRTSPVQYVHRGDFVTAFATANTSYVLGRVME
jgi:hypothetical protein